MKKVFITSLVLIFFDQLLKIWVKTNMLLWQKIELFNSDKAALFFIENNGAAFGLFGDNGETAKVALTLFRILIVYFGIVYIKSIAPKLSFGALISLGLIIGGAIGNIIDSSFYGLLFNESGTIYAGETSKFISSKGYAPIFQGKVVDMFSFPLFTVDLPSWLDISIPFSELTLLTVLEGGDNRFTFFQPVFNLADAGISIGVFLLLIFYRKDFN